MNSLKLQFGKFFVHAGITVAAILLFAAGAVAEPLRVGLILPLSGALSEYGVAFKNGLELAQKEDPEIVTSVRFTFEDSQYDNKQALSAFEKLTGADRCSLVFVWGSGPSEAVAPVAEKRKFPLIILGEHTAAVGRANVLTFTNPSAQFSKALIEYLRSQGYKKFAIVLTQITYFETLSRTFREQLRSEESISIVDTYLPGDSDFKATISKIGREKPEALGIYLLNGQVSLFYRQLNSQKLQIPTFGTDVFESSSEIRDSQPMIEGAVYPHSVVGEVFQNLYLSTFRNDVQLPTAARGYDFANLVARNVDATNAEPGKALFQRLTRLSPQQGASGEFKFVDSPEFGQHFEFPIAVKKIVNGKPTVVRE